MKPLWQREEQLDYAENLERMFLEPTDKAARVVACVVAILGLSAVTLAALICW